jgi:uncharacterized RDD family membrane protein YckC
VTTGATESSAATPAVEHAGFWKRLFAFVIDLGVTSLIFFAMAIILPILLGPRLGVPGGSVILASGAVIWLVITWLYWAIMESSSKQGTVGKNMLGIVVTDAEGNRLSFLKATVRHFSKVASALPVLAGFILAGFTAKKQGLHDLITGSLVVMKRERDACQAPGDDSQPGTRTPATQ